MSTLFLRLEFDLKMLLFQKHIHCVQTLKYEYDEYAWKRVL